MKLYPSTFTVMIALFVFNSAMPQVKIGINPSSINPNSVLDLESTNKGLLLPRLLLTGTGNTSPLSAHVAGMMVYNKATAGNVTPGIYYNTGSQWIRLGQAAQASWYKTIANTGSTSNTDSVYIMGKVGIGTTNPKTRLSLAGNTLALQTISINDTAVIYLPTQGFANGQFYGSVAFGNGLRKLYRENEGDAQENTAVGMGALYETTIGRRNTAIGNESLYNNTTGEENTATGYFALYTNTTGYGNTANGNATLNSNTTGYLNTAIGTRALNSNSTGISNTAIGSNALTSNATGNQNCAIGSYSLFLNTTGAANTSNGYNALHSNTTGSQNCSMGWNSLAQNTTGGDNTALGTLAGSTLTSGNNNLFIGYNSQPSSANVTNEITVGNSNNNKYRMYASSWTNASDSRLKHDIEDLAIGLDFVQQLRPTQYVYNNANNEEISFGFIAQEVQDALRAYPELNKSNLVNILEEKNKLLGLKTSDLLPVAIKAIQQQQAIIGAQQVKMEALQIEIDTIKTELEAIKKIIMKQ